MICLNNSFLIIEMSLTKNKDLDYLICFKLDNQSLLNLCLINKYYYYICNDFFWKLKNI